MRDFFWLGVGFAIANAIFWGFLEFDRWWERRQVERVKARQFQLDRLQGRRP